MKVRKMIKTGFHLCQFNSVSLKWKTFYDQSNYFFCLINFFSASSCNALATFSFLYFLLLSPFRRCRIAAKKANLWSTQSAFCRKLRTDAQLWCSSCWQAGDGQLAHTRNFILELLPFYYGECVPWEWKVCAAAVIRRRFYLQRPRRLKK